jgi:hypothetical protein
VLLEDVSVLFDAISVFGRGCETVFANAVEEHCRDNYIVS